MRVEEVCKRKYNGETYTYYYNSPEYPGEKGVLGIEIEPYVSVKTPENGFGYDDTILFSKGKGYTLNRYCPPWIIRKAEEMAKRIMKQKTGMEI